MLVLSDEISSEYFEKGVVPYLKIEMKLAPEE
jgi:hypothetical protein